MINFPLSVVFGFVPGDAEDIGLPMDPASWPDVLAYKMGEVEDAALYDLTDPVGVEYIDGRFELVDGHHRVAIAHAHGLPEIPVVAFWPDDVDTGWALLDLAREVRA